MLPPLLQGIFFTQVGQNSTVGVGHFSTAADTLKTRSPMAHFDDTFFLGKLIDQLRKLLLVDSI